MYLYPLLFDSETPKKSTVTKDNSKVFALFCAGFSDPFVIIELLPRKMFSHCSEQQTNVQKKTLNPMFDECFEL
jgi:Ca2+-dependent lipid-binding protein